MGGVLAAFAEEARTHWGEGCITRDIWAVASRHSIAGTKGSWAPRSLVNYHPSYRSEGGARGKADRFCRLLQKAAMHHQADRPPVEVAEMLATGIAGFARVHHWQSPSSQPLTARNVWATLAHRDPGLPRAVRRLLHDHVLCGRAPWQEDAWTALVDVLLPLFAPLPDEALANLVDHCEFVASEKADLADPERRSTKQVDFGEVRLRLGSIHSVKGKTVDGILVVESEVWKDRPGAWT